MKTGLGGCLGKEGKSAQQVGGWAGWCLRMKSFYGHQARIFLSMTRAPSFQQALLSPHVDRSIQHSQGDTRQVLCGPSQPVQCTSSTGQGPALPPSPPRGDTASALPSILASFTLGCGCVCGWGGGAGVCVGCVCVGCVWGYRVCVWSSKPSSAQVHRTQWSPSPTSATLS